MSMMNEAMQSYRDQSHPSSSGRHSHGHYGPRSSSSGGASADKYNGGRRRDQGSGHDSSSNRSISSSRWQPPKRRQSSRSSNPTGGDGTSMDIDYINHAGGASQGHRGGGKIMNRHKHQRKNRQTNDTYNPRNQYRPKNNIPKKNIITPDEDTTTTTSSNQSSTTPPKSNNDNNDTTPKLDPSDPVHARRIRQRRRQVLFGKNTAGYEEYTKQIPRHKRRHRSLECPMTPDHMLDIPTKRWQGLMNAWRRSLHKYDPPDLHLRQPAQTTITLAPRPCTTEADKQQEEIAQAKAAGLQVAFGSMAVGKEAGMFSMRVAAEEEETTTTNPVVVENAASPGKSEEEEVPFEEEAAYRQMGGEEGGMDGGGFLEEGCDTDSDDDLL